MATEQIFLFSSDAEQLYKADIFRCLALPCRHTIQFRYPEEVVHPEILQAPSKFKGRAGTVVFVGGNNQRIKPNERKLTLHAIRFALIKEIFLDPHTSQVVAILELSQFVDCEWEVTGGPPLYFLCPGQLTNHNPSTWLERVRQVEAWYPNTVFFRLNRVLHRDTPIIPKYLAEPRMSRFDLVEETEYSLECVYYHPGGDGLTPLSMVPDSEIIRISNTFAVGAGAPLDMRRVLLKTGLLASRSEHVFITFSASKKPADDPNHLHLLWEIRRPWWKEWIIFVSVLCAAIGLGLVQSGAKNQYGEVLPFWDIIARLAGAILIAVPALWLYRFLNKA